MLSNKAIRELEMACAEYENAGDQLAANRVKVIIALLKGTESDYYQRVGQFLCNTLNIRQRELFNISDEELTQYIRGEKKVYQQSKHKRRA